MSNVFKKCIPGGVALVIAVLAIYLYDRLGLAAGMSMAGLSMGVYKTMLIFAVVYTGFMSLLVISQPFDKYRVVVSLITFVIATFCLTGVVELLKLVSSLGNGMLQFELFGEGVVPFYQLDFQFITFLISIICINYFVISGMTKLVNSIKPKKGDKTNGNQPT